MRTTLTLDEDVAALIEKEIRRSGKPFKVAINDLLRLGLAAESTAKRRFKVEPRSLGLPAGMSYDNVQELLDQLEGNE